MKVGNTLRRMLRRDCGPTHLSILQLQVYKFTSLQVYKFTSSYFSNL